MCKNCPVKDPGCSPTSLDWLQIRSDSLWKNEYYLSDLLFGFVHLWKVFQCGLLKKNLTKTFPLIDCEILHCLIACNAIQCTTNSVNNEELIFVNLMCLTLKNQNFWNLCCWKSEVACMQVKCTDSNYTCISTITSIKKQAQHTPFKDSVAPFIVFQTAKWKNKINPQCLTIVVSASCQWCKFFSGHHIFISNLYHQHSHNKR